MNQQQDKKEEQHTLLEEQITQSLWFRIFVILFVIVILGLFGYRYFLAGKAINASQYWTAAALASPELGLIATLV